VSPVVVRTSPRAAAPPAPARRAAWPWALAAALVPAAALAVHVARHHAGDVSGTYHVTRNSYWTLPLHRAYPPGALRLQEGAYDGAYFLALANDPLLRAWDDSSRFYRGRRILWPWAGWLLGAGRPAAILQALPLANLLLLGLATWALARLLADGGRHPAWALLHALSLGAAGCLLRSLSDLFAVNLVLLGAWAWHRERPATGALLFALAALAKETALLAPAVLGALAWVEGRRRRALLLSLVPALVLAWWFVVWWGSPHHSIGKRNIGLPGAGILAALSPTGARPAEEPWVLPLALFALGAAVAAGRRAWDRWRAVAAAFVALAGVSTGAIWVEHWAHGRAFLAVPALLLFRYSVSGRALDLMAPVAAALGGIVVWGCWL